MKRRTFIATSGTFSLAGCGSLEERDPRTEEEATEMMNQKTDQTTTTQAEVRIDSDEWIIEGEAVEFIVANYGSEPCGELELVVQWFDTDGNYIGSDSDTLPTLRDGTSWHTTVETSAPFEATSYETYVQYDSEPSWDDLSVHDATVDNENKLVSGSVTSPNPTESSILVQVVAYDSGWITHTGYTFDQRVPAESSWRFLIPLSSVAFETEVIGENLEIHILTE